MTIADKIIDEKLQYLMSYCSFSSMILSSIVREAAKILALSPGKIDKYEYLTGDERMSSDQSRII